MLEGWYGSVGDHEARAAVVWLSRDTAATFTRIGGRIAHDVPVSDDVLLDRVRQLRQRGVAPKQIARTLGMSPAAVAPLVRRVAELDQARSEPSERVLVGCWVNPGWSRGLDLGKAPDWAATDPPGIEGPGTEGLVSILLARQERASRTTVCGFLVDVYCLGVKNAIGPLSMGMGSVETYRGAYFQAYDAPGISIPVELAQHLVFGAVAYARELGFEPHADFAAAAPHLGSPVGACPIRFGRDGKPCYVSGPYDDPRTIMRTLEKKVGKGNYSFLSAL
jgi:hypothetical protein